VGEPIGARPCPNCGATVSGQYCQHCGFHVGPGAADGPDRLSSPPAGNPSGSDAEGRFPVSSLDAPTVPSLPVVPRTDGPVSALPAMFPTEIVPAASLGASQAWSQVPEPPAAGPHTGLFPGWTGMYPAVSGGEGSGPMASAPVRRRRALYAVLGVAAVTAIVLLAALLIAPNWGGSANVADKDGQPTPTVSNPASSAPSSAPLTSGPVQPPPASTTTTTGGAGTGTRVPIRTVTVTAKPTVTKPSTTAPATTKPATKPKPKPTPKPTPTTKKLFPLGVPQKEIACSGGYIVQLASELDAGAFAARVASLKAAGQVPPGSLAADSSKSCKIFSIQSNALVLYAGPFSSKYDGCAARLAGPADAYIKGSNPGSAQEYVSCLCPAQAGGLPQFRNVGQQGVWVGELQRVLGHKLNIDVSDVAGNWGTYTAGTRAAVQAFQKAVKIPASGVVDGRTWRALQSAEC
jgi:peptidoglycan hydrolase-like protein with peptidoglycan-binding domain